MWSRPDHVARSHFPASRSGGPQIRDRRSRASRSRPTSGAQRRAARLIRRAGRRKYSPSLRPLAGLRAIARSGEGCLLRRLASLTRIGASRETTTARAESLATPRRRCEATPRLPNEIFKRTRAWSRARFRWRRLRRGIAEHRSRRSAQRREGMRKRFRRPLRGRLQSRCGLGRRERAVLVGDVLRVAETTAGCPLAAASREWADGLDACKAS